MVSNWLPQATSAAINGLQSAKSSIRQVVVAGEVFERGFRARADVLDHFACGQRAEAAAGAIVGATGEAGEEAGGKQIAGASSVDDTFDWKSRHRLDAVGTDHQTTLLAARDHRG